MKCTHCQTPNPAGALSCQNCGSAFDGGDFGATLEVVDPTAILVGAEFGPRYQVMSVLGTGGMGKVYQAFDRELERTVALKVLRPELVADPQALQRFKQELLLASKISHPNVLRIHDLGDYRGLKYISMAFIEGGDLAKILKKNGALPVERGVNLMKQLCEALQAAHSAEVVHRDLKPQNILVDSDDHVYVSDFGLAKTLEPNVTGMTRTGAIMGTPLYMSPEQVQGKEVDHRTDLYAVGLIFYEMLTGALPFVGESSYQLMYKRVNEAPKRPEILTPGLPPYISRICLRCLEKEPTIRYQNASEIVEDLRSKHAPSISLARTVQITLPEPAVKWGLVTGVGILLLAALFFAIPATRHLVVKAPSASAVGNSGLPPLSRGKYVAVLRFRLLGSDKSLNYVAEGLDEALSAKLFQLNDVRLASPSAAAKVNDQNTPLPQIAKDLGVNMIVHGLVQGSGEQLRVVVNLENMEENRLEWSQEFSGLTGDLLTIEDQIYAKLVDALNAKPTNSALAAATTHPTENVAAYNEYLKGRDVLGGAPDEKNIQAAMDHFSTALEKDPGFALAYTGLVDAELMLYREKKDKHWSEKAVEAARKAAQINDKLPQVHSAMGSAFAATGQNVQAIAEHKRALELAPNSDEGYRRLGNAYKANGQKQEALQALQKAVDLNPYYWNNLAALGNAYVVFGELEKAVTMFKQVVQLEPNNPAGYNNLGLVYFSLGRYEESIATFQKSLNLAPSAQVYTNLATAYFYMKRYPEALPLFEKAVEMSPEDQSFMGNLADGYRWAGNKDKAQATYEKAIALAYKQLRVNPRDANVVGQLALYYAKKGDSQQAKDFVKKARAINPSDVYSIYIAAVVDTLGNRPAEAVQNLTKALEKGFSPGDVAVEPEFAALEARPDFQAMMKRFPVKKR